MESSGELGLQLPKLCEPGLRLEENASARAQYLVMMVSRVNYTEITLRIKYVKRVESVMSECAYHYFFAETIPLDDSHF